VPEARYLVVNADDFGQSEGINAGIVEAHERGIVTSASLMVRWAATANAVDYARRHTELGLGLHMDLGEWVYRADEWVRAYEVVPDNDPKAVAAEVQHQIVTFRRLVGRDPTHLDSHQHVHRQEPVRSILRQVAAELAVPLRESSRGVRYCGSFYGQSATGGPFPEGIEVDNLLRILRELRPGVTELGCHPGLGADVPAPYQHERAHEVRALCDPRVRAAVDELGIRLGGFGPRREPTSIACC
jgi:chitin disaccharide deacetylase